MQSEDNVDFFMGCGFVTPGYRSLIRGKNDGVISFPQCRGLGFA